MYRPRTRSALLPARALPRRPPPPLPEIGEIDLVRHYVNLSKRNMSIDTNFYPLGSCTMKYNPKRHERLAALPSMAGLHPLQDDSSCQGMLEMMWQMQNILQEISGLDAISLQPLPPGAQWRVDRPADRRSLLSRSRRNGANAAC